ncbi:nucleotidyltransferase family protein [Candidatus Chloroploca sp. M-50]|uniref:Nucleotidyltransferase family protein n=2 Tax=Candidatus Chloroploca mongolica TaxID=2528176 RepID=A0ABS4D762_9CHLR|nr:nucleotidyltransferase family protein [Candidatus Chloroploca mongolica]
MARLPIDYPQLVQLCQRNGVIYLGVFGSTARGEARPDSDIDLLVRFRVPKSLIAFLAFEEQLAALFPRTVDLLTDGSLSPYLRDQVFRDLRVVYESA